MESMLKQTHQEIEIILVNDGSTDNSGDVCDGYAKADTRVRIIHQDNAGVAAAFNSGLDMAQGEWIGFAGSDDWVEHDMYEKLLSSAVQHNKLVVCCGMVVHPLSWEGAKSSYNIVYPGIPSTITSSQYFDNLAGGVATSFVSVATKLYHCSLLTGSDALRFDVECFRGSDYLFSAKIILKVGEFAFIPEPLCHYCRRDNSISTQSINERSMTLFKSLGRTVEAVELVSQDLAHFAKLYYANAAYNSLWKVICSADMHSQIIVAQLRKEALRYINTFVFSNKITFRLKIRYLIVLTCPILAKKLRNVLRCIKQSTTSS